MRAVKISNNDIVLAEQKLLPANSHFDAERRDFIQHMESCDLVAVPGSGKTTALLAKLICISKQMPLDTGILVLAHTNAAIDEIKNNLQSVCPRLFEYPNFVGTIQEFVDTYLAIPFYQSRFHSPVVAIDSDVYKREIKDVMLPIRKDRVWNYYINTYKESIASVRFRVISADRCILVDGENTEPLTVVPNPPQTWEEKDYDTNRRHIYDVLTRRKILVLKRGILSYDDAYFLADFYIMKMPVILHILRKQFGYVFVDETQDLSPQQISIIDLIFNHTDCVLQRLGDPNQAIYTYSGVEQGNVWTPRHVKKFNRSHRLTPHVAKVVTPLSLDNLTRNEGTPIKAIEGSRTHEEAIRPYAILFTEVTKDKLLPKFEELIRRYDLCNTLEGKKYGFHVIGWSLTWNEPNDKGQLRLEDIVGKEVVVKNKAKKRLATLSEHIQFGNTTNNHECKTTIYSIICEILRILEIAAEDTKGEKKYYTLSSVQKYIDEQDAVFQGKISKDIYNVTFSLQKKDYDRVYKCMKQCALWLSRKANGYDVEKLRSFLGEKLETISVPIQQEEENQRGNPTYIVGSVHSAKGQTHCGTLYIDTSYYGKYDSGHIAVKRGNTYISPLDGEDVIYDANSEKRAKTAAKMMYVGFSRPTHLLCYAIMKTTYKWQPDEDKLKSAGWEVIDLTKE